MQYLQIPPPAELQPYIRHFWVLEGDTTSQVRSFRTLADGTPGFIFQNKEKGILYQFDKQLPASFLYGQATKAAAIHIDGEFDTIGIFFQPYGLKAIFGIDAQELTDDCMELNPYFSAVGDMLSAVLQREPTTEMRIRKLVAFISEQASRQARNQDSAIIYAAQQIWKHNGNLELADLRSELFLTERSFERKFKQYVGLSPKLFSRIVKFQSSLQSLRTASFEKLSDIAYRHQYADQSHFIRNFREFAGCSPLQLQQLREKVMDSSVTVII